MVGMRLFVFFPVLVGVVFAMLFGMGCEPEIGGLCDPDKAKVNAKVAQEKGVNNLVQDVELDNCSEGFCLSSDGSRPYCTKRCTADTECLAEAGTGFTCQIIISFGPLACQDYEDPSKPRPGVKSSLAKCTTDTDCTTANETCLGAVANTSGSGQCGIAGRDCLTGPPVNGVVQPSTLPFKYCAASSATIAARDKAYGR
jgi:hypothetical protein